MDFLHVQNLVRKPQLYATESDVMWTDPCISRQLLQFHIDPDNDTASRSRAKIKLTVKWILDRIPRRKMDTLDLGCGPGLYAEKLAEYGHQVTGIDFSKNSIDYAKAAAARNNSRNSFVYGNYLDMDFSNRFDLAIMIYLDFCVLKPQERKIVLQKHPQSPQAG